MPFEDPERKRAYMQSYRESQREQRKKEQTEMLVTINKIIASQNPCDVNCVLQLDTDLRFYKNFGDYRRDHPNATFPDFQEYENDQTEWLNERKSERTIAVQKALTHLVSFEQNPKIELWRKLFPKFFKKYEK